MQPSSKNNAPFEFKGSLFTLTVLHLFNSDINAFSAQLRYHAEKTPNLFKNMPLVIDLQRIANQEHEVDFDTLQHQLREHGLIPVGVRHGTEKLNHAAQAAGLAILSNQSSKARPAPTKTAPASSTLFITKPIRSGQQVYARQGDLVVLAPVSAGAELLADGSIHVYGSLRGRALAGVGGDQTARIFCHKLEAELVSIAGHYRLSESLPEIKATTVQVYLEDEKVCIAGLPQ
jgi:septum site-determining protein MinC